MALGNSELDPFPPNPPPHRLVATSTEACGIPSHMASEHLGKMKDRGLLTAERRGRQIFYQVSEPHLANIMACVEARFR